MKNSFRIAFGIGFLVFVSGIATANAQPGRTGGYKDISNSDEAVQTAAEFAVSTQAERTGKEMSLVEVVKAERQVVAGSNYRMCLQVTSEGGEGQDSVTIAVQVVVYVDLKGNRKLSSWAISECGDE